MYRNGNVGDRVIENVTWQKGIITSVNQSHEDGTFMYHVKFGAIEVFMYDNELIACIDPQLIMREII